MTRWGRRKPYIFIGSILDVVFLFGLASSNSILAIAAFLALLQFSSNFAQGPFQGYVPDLVPGPQVSTASALVGMMQILGNVVGVLVASIAIGSNLTSPGSWSSPSSNSPRCQRRHPRDDGKSRRARASGGGYRLEAWGTDPQGAGFTGWSGRDCSSSWGRDPTGFVIIYLASGLNRKEQAESTLILLAIIAVTRSSS
jgi:MFS-type transporter involved in bile tolerance (Atg22 family)